jgi:hypothetical protein
MELGKNLDHMGRRNSLEEEADMFRTNYLRPRKGSRAKRSVIEQEGMYRCRKCLQIFYSDVKYRKHD